MAITSGRGSASKLSYLVWTRDTSNANAGTIAVTHGKDADKVRTVSVVDMASNGGLGRLVTAAEYIVNLTSDTVTTVTNSCGAAANGTAVADGSNTGNATTPTAAGTYTGLADGVVTVTCTKSGNLGVTLIDSPAVLVGSGSANTLTTTGTYTVNLSGSLVGTVTLTGELGTATVDWVFPDGTTVAAWVSGATTVATTISQGVDLAMTSDTGDDLVAGDIITITLHGIAEFGAVFPDGSTVSAVPAAATTVGTAIGQGWTLALTSGAGVDVIVDDVFTATLAAGTKDLKVYVSYF